jgi:GT2 family glycosyltransferase
MLISVIIPTSNRPKLLANLLDALRAQILDRPFEIIVVDDGLRTDLEHLSFQTARCKCTVLHGKGKGSARARNLGVLHAAGSYLVFLDDDSVVDPSYLARVRKDLDERPNSAVAGPQRSIDRQNSFSLAAEWLVDCFVRAERLNPRRFGFAASNGFALRREDFVKSGPFNPHFYLAAGEDREFCGRWISAGFHIDVLDELAIEHHFPTTLRAFWKQQWRYGRGAVHYRMYVSPEKRPRVRSIRFYWDLVFGPLRRHGLSRGARVSLLAALSQLAVWAGYMRERMASPKHVSKMAQPATEPTE